MRGEQAELWISEGFFFYTISHSIIIGKQMKNRVDKWTVRRTENWMNCWAQRAVPSSIEATRQPVTSCVLQGSILSPVLCNVFIDDLADGTNCTFSYFEENKNCDKLLIDQMVVLPFRRSLASCRNESTRNSWGSAKGNANLLFFFYSGSGEILAQIAQRRGDSILVYI